jgi:hypothetical protein
VSLIGNVTLLGQDDPALDPLKECYVARHPDARSWLPGDEDGAHRVRVSCMLEMCSEQPDAATFQAYWARFDPHVRPHTFVSALVI